MAIKKLKNGTYKIEVYVGGKVVHYEHGFRTRTLAKDKHEAIRLEFKSDPSKLAPVKTPTWDELLERYVNNYLPSIRPSTRRRYMSDIEQRLRKEFQFRKLDDISPAHVREFRNRLHSTLKPKSINNCISLLSSIFNYGIEEERLMTSNPARLKPLEGPKDDYDWWEEWSDVEFFLEKTRKHRYGAAFRLALECGLRLGEIIGLKKQDIDLENCIINVNQQWLEKEECYGPPKGGGPRKVGFKPSSELRTMLQETIERSNDPEIIFVTKSGLRQRPRKLSGEAFQNVIRSLGLPRITFHELRHSFASWYMIRRTGDDSLWKLSKLLGHKDTNVTMKYAHHDKQVERVPDPSIAPTEELFAVPTDPAQISQRQVNAARVLLAAWEAHQNRLAIESGQNQAITGPALVVNY